MNKYLLIDIGGTSIKVVTYKDEFIFENEYPTNASKGGEFLVETIINIIDEYEDLDAISISTAGQVDREKGLIVYANENIPNYTNTNWKEILENKNHIPVFVENDVNAAALGEAYYGNGKEYHDFLCLTYGTGIGGAIIINNEIYRGAFGSAGEFGALLIHSDKHQEDKPFSGSYEEYASTTALIEKAKAYDSSITDGRILFSRIEEKEIRMIVDEWINEISYGLISLIHIFNPELIIIGGGIMEQDYIFDKLKDLVYSNIMDTYKKVEIKKAYLGNKAGLYGALARIKKEIR